MRHIAFAVALVLTAAAAAAEPPEGVTALAHCERRSSSGRVVCEVESEVKQGRIAYADAIVIEAPEKARPLRSRVGLSEAIAVTPQRVRLPLGFFAEDLGSGTIRVRSRLVVCRATGPRSETCLPRTVETQAQLVVGPLSAGDTP